MPVPINPLKDTKVFDSIKVGNIELKNKIVYVPTTRFRALEDHTPSDLNVEYYGARSKYPGTLVVVEGTHPSYKTGVFKGAPGIWTESHVKGWKAVTDKIHSNGSFASVQLWGLGRVADPALTKKEGAKLIGPSPLYYTDEQKKEAEEAGNPIHELTEEEIKELIYEDYTLAAKNAVKAGFDILELHGAHGYLLDTFLQPVTNKRTDKYGGSIENRARFVLELIDHLTSIIGAEKLAIRLSPWAKFQGMKAEEDEVHPVAQFGYLIGELEKRGREGKRLAYISVVEPRVSGNISVNEDKQVGDNTFVKTIWKGVLLRAGNYSYDAPAFNTLLNDVSDGRTLVGFSRFFTSNPDLVKRLHDGLSLSSYDRPTFYSAGNWRYNTWPEFGSDEPSPEDGDSKRVPQPIAG